MRTYFIMLFGAAGSTQLFMRHKPALFGVMVADSLILREA